MEFTVFVDDRPPPAAGEWPQMEPRRRVIVDVNATALLDSAATEAVTRFGPAVQRVYRAQDDGRPIYMAIGIDDAAAERPSLVRFPSVVPDENGEAWFTEGARHKITLADLARARSRGFFNGDPNGIFLEPPQFMGEALPGWIELFHWLENNAAGSVLVAGFVALVKRGYGRWRDRGAYTPFAFLDLLTARTEWSQRELEALLGLSPDDARELLKCFGFAQSDDNDDRWLVSADPTSTDLRRRVIEDYFRRRYDDGLPADSEEAAEAESLPADRSVKASVVSRWLRRLRGWRA
jgi:hypothetical protein